MSKTTIPTGGIADDAINLTSKVTGALPVANGGTALTSGFVNGGGLTGVDMWRVTADFAGSVNPIASNLERCDETGFGKIGTGMTNSSGTFSFPATGFWMIRFTAFHYTDNSADYISIKINTTTDNSTYALVAQGIAQINAVDAFNQGTAACILDVTDVSTCKVRFETDHADTSNKIRGQTGYNRSWFEFIRLGDT